MNDRKPDDGTSHATTPRGAYQAGSRSITIDRGCEMANINDNDNAERERSNDATKADRARGNWTGIGGVHNKCGWPASGVGKGRRGCWPASERRAPFAAIVGSAGQSAQTTQL